MPRFYLPPASWTETPYLEGDEAKHLCQVLRIQEGQEITVFDGLGNFAPARVLSTSKQRVDLLLELAEHIPSSQPEITLIQAIPKGKNMDWIVQKSVELGVTRIQPIITQHTIVSPDADKAEKWRRTALEACKQCGQYQLPLIDEPVSFSHWIKNRSSTDLEIIASLSEHAKNFREILAARPKLQSISILVGPEGDFSPQETAEALEQGMIPISLGELVLRVETATLFALSAIRFQYL